MQVLLILSSTRINFATIICKILVGFFGFFWDVYQFNWKYFFLNVQNFLQLLDTKFCRIQAIKSIICAILINPLKTQSMTNWIHR